MYNSFHSGDCRLSFSFSYLLDWKILNWIKHHQIWYITSNIFASFARNCTFYVSMIYLTLYTQICVINGKKLAEMINENFTIININLMNDHYEH